MFYLKSILSFLYISGGVCLSFGQSNGSAAMSIHNQQIRQAQEMNRQFQHMNRPLSPADSVSQIDQLIKRQEDQLVKNLKKKENNTTKINQKTTELNTLQNTSPQDTKAIEKVRLKIQALSEKDRETASDISDLQKSIAELKARKSEIIGK
ncbi:hypothetical protein [Chryseobacterium indologenes]|nr:hypothetical protein [Chryseobacterium indologenes]